MEAGAAVDSAAAGGFGRRPMMARLAVRGLHLIMVLYLVASGIELLDRSGLASQHAVVGDTAQTMRDVREGDDRFGVVDEIERAIEAVNRLSDAFTEAGEALN